MDQALPEKGEKDTVLKIASFISEPALRAKQPIPP